MEFSFDSTQEQVISFELLPNDWYEAMIINSDVLQNNAGTGRYIKLEFEIVSGKYQNRKIFTNLNIEHPNANVAAFGRSDLTKICRAIKVEKLFDTCSLHNLPMMIKVAVAADKGRNNELRNVIRDYKAKGEVTPEMGMPVPANTVENVAPWARQ